MSGFEITMLTFAGLCLAAAIGPAIYKHLIVPELSLERQAEYAENQWREERRREGRTPDEIHVESWVRYGLAEIQEQVAEAIDRNDGADIDAELNEIAQRQVEAKAALDPAIGRSLKNVVTGLRGEDLVPPESLAKLEQQYRSGSRTPPDHWLPPEAYEEAGKVEQTQAEKERAAWVRLNAFTTRG